MVHLYHILHIGYIDSEGNTPLSRRQGLVVGVGVGGFAEESYSLTRRRPGMTWVSIMDSY